MVMLGWAWHSQPCVAALARRSLRACSSYATAGVTGIKMHCRVKGAGLACRALILTFKLPHSPCCSLLQGQQGDRAACLTVWAAPTRSVPPTFAHPLICSFRCHRREGGLPGRGRPHWKCHGRRLSHCGAVSCSPGGLCGHPLWRQPLHQLHVPLDREPLQVRSHMPLADATVPLQGSWFSRASLACGV